MMSESDPKGVCLGGSLSDVQSTSATSRTAATHRTLDTHSRRTTTVQSHYALRILGKDERTDKIIELTNAGFECEPRKTLAELIDEITFQDNTLAFKILLSQKKMVIIIYPPGSGKTTMALLLQSFLSTTECSEKVMTFLDNCEYAKSCKTDFNKFRKSGNVAYISFEDIQGTSRIGFEKSLITIMLNFFKLYFSEQIVEEERATLNESRGCVYTSLQRFVLNLIDKTKTTYLLLDSCDTVYNAIAQIGPEADAVCKLFTTFVKGTVRVGITDFVLICFGVSPYFAYEFSGKAYIYDIGSTTNELGVYFSYSIETIDKVIREWELPTSSDECKKLAQLRNDNRVFVNPAICVSFLRCLHLKQQVFQVDLVPRSLWLSSIFTPDDRDLLLDILRGPCEKEFSMGVDILSLISKKLDRKLFYPLFIYGGFLSCIPSNQGKYELSIANDTSRCVLEKSLDDIYLEIYERGFEECGEIYRMIIKNKWREFCDSLSRMLSVRSPRTMSNERDYNNWLEGLLNVSTLHGFSTKYVTVKNNVPLAGLFPDITSSGPPELASVWELKLVKPKKKTSRCSTLGDSYGLIDASGDHKRSLLPSIKREFKNALDQISQYASFYLTAENCESVKCIIAIFYLNHVVLFVSTYLFQSRDAESRNVTSSPWTVHCSDGFFSEAELENLLKP